MPFQKRPSYASDAKYLHQTKKKKKVIINKKLMELGSDSQSVSENS